MKIPTEKVCQKLSFSAQSAKLTLKRAFENFFSKKVQWTHRGKCSLANLAESCSLEVRETFLTGVGKSFKIYSFYFLYLPQSVSLDSLEAIMVNLPINICHCPGNFPSSSKVIYSQFFDKWKFQKISSGQRQFRFIYPTGSFAKSQETLCEQLRNTHEIIQTKTDSLPQIFALDLYKAIMTALTEIFCINIKNCRSKSGNDYQGVLKKKFPFPQDIFWTIWLQFQLRHRKLCRILKKF